MLYFFTISHIFAHCAQTHKMKFLKPAPSGGLLATKTEDIPLESHTPHMVVSIQLLSALSFSRVGLKLQTCYTICLIELDR